MAHLRVLKDQYQRILDSDKDVDLYIVDSGYGTYTEDKNGVFQLENAEFPHMFDKETAEYIESIYMTAKSYTWREWYNDQVVLINMTLLLFNNNNK